MKKFQMRMIMVLLTISSALCIMVELKKIEVPNLIVYTEILGLYILGFIIKLYTTIKFDPKDIPWAVASIYVVSFLISFQEFRIYNETILVSLYISFSLGDSRDRYLCLGLFKS